MSIASLNLPATPGEGRGTTDPLQSEHRRRAWQQAMEQAQLAQWFLPPQAQPETAVAPRAAASGSAPPPVSASGPVAARRVPPAAAAQAVAPGAAGGELPLRDPAGAHAAGLSVGPGHPGASAAADRSLAAPLSEGPALRVEHAGKAQVHRAVAAVAAGAGQQPAPAWLPAGPLAAALEADIAAWLDAPAPVGTPWRDAAPAATGGVPVAQRLPAAQLIAWPAPARPRREAASEPDGESAPAMPAAAAHEAAADPQAVRIHVDITAEGARVWLGVDADRLAAIPALARYLEQRLRAGGLRLAALICNGRPVPLHSILGDFA